MTYKCNCRVPDIMNWSVIKISGRDWIVRCSACRQVWHTTAAYAAELSEKPISRVFLSATEMPHISIVGRATQARDRESTRKKVRQALLFIPSP